MTESPGAPSACLCCTSTGSARRFTVPETMLGTGDVFRYVECAACGTLRLDPIPDDLGRYYPESYFSFAERTAPSSRGNPLRHLAGLTVVGRKSRFQSALVFAQSPSWADWFAGLGMALDEPVLDVGSGSGSTLQNLTRYGFSNLTGVDPFVPKDIDYPNGVRIRKARLEELSGSYRVILFNHSLEHSPDPAGQLRHAWGLLSPHGRLVVRLPILGGSYRRHGIAFVGLEEAPRHVFIPSVKGLLALARRTGFVAARVLHDGNAHHVLVSERRASDGLAPRIRSQFRPGRLARLEAGVRARWQNRRSEGDTATFLFSAG